MIETVQTQIASHLDAMEKDIRNLRATLLPLPDSRLVWNFGSVCRLTGSRMIALARDVEAAEAERKLHRSPPPVTEPVKPADLFEGGEA